MRYRDSRDLLMVTSAVEGTQGYAHQAKSLFEKYRSVSFENKHQAVIEFFPSIPCQVLDIGAGPGFDLPGLQTKAAM